MVGLLLLFSLMGMELFSYCYEDTSEHRVIFNDILNSMAGIMLIFYNEEWHLSMYEHIEILQARSILFFLSITLLGNIISFFFFFNLQFNFFF